MFLNLLITLVVASSLVAAGLISENQLYSNSSVAINRNKRQSTSHCKKTEWKCRDGSCIKFSDKCDGIVNCPDGSDETYSACRNTPCQDNLFRCTYGACVDGTAPCNNIQECADNSDELQLSCFSEPRTTNDNFKCDDGNSISARLLCDGVKDCSDGSDETIRVCANQTCPSYLFKCAYGACADADAECNNVQDCADNSDEADEICNRYDTFFSGRVLPPYPQHGRYVVKGLPSIGPGKPVKYNQQNITIICDEGYATVDGVYDIKLTVDMHIPDCKRFCTLERKRGVIYNCITSQGKSQLSEPCPDRVFVNTTVIPTCDEPNYHGRVSAMFCIDGQWSSKAKCKPDCGRVSPEGVAMTYGGTPAKHGELTWHAGLYTKNGTVFKQFCGGSIVTTKNVISAAHCFWAEGKIIRPAPMVSVAVGTIYRPWNNSNDQYAQHFDVEDIHLPTEFRGNSLLYQYDIAVVVLKTEIVYSPYVRPICIDFSIDLNDRLLAPQIRGKVGGWGMDLTGMVSRVLRVVELEIMSFDKCFSEAPLTYRMYLGPDKFCAGFTNGSAGLCNGDSGEGLAVPGNDGVNKEQRYYLMGIASTTSASKSVGQECNPGVATFLKLMKHQEFLQLYVNFNEE